MTSIENLIPIEIKEAIEKNELIIFAGAGL